MYQQFFGLKEMPFTLSPDTQYFYLHRSHQEALNVLLVALECGEGFIKIIGEVGTGKTLLCRELLNRLGDEYYTAYIPNPYMSPISLRKSLAEELGVIPDSMSDYDVLKAINKSIIELNAYGKKVIVCMDEAQAIPDQTLEALRLLSNLETEKSKLLQIVLFGQPELDEKLAKPRNRQLRQRIVHAYTLQPLDGERIANYLDHRLHVAGYNGEPLFGRAAIDRLYRASGGVPRLVNILSNKSLLLAFGRGKHLVDEGLVKEAVCDTEGVVEQPSWFKEQVRNIGFVVSMFLLLYSILWIGKSF